MLKKFNQLYNEIYSSLIYESEELEGRLHKLDTNSDVLQITNVETLQKLAKSSDAKVRMEVAANQNTPEEVLKELSEDKEYMVKQEVAFNPNTPTEVLSNLAEKCMESNEGKAIILGIMQNPKASKDLLVKFMDNPDPKIKELAAKTLKEQK